MNRDDALELVARLQAIWPDRWTAGRADQWVDVMVGCDLEAATAAVVRFRGTHEKLPAISEFVGVVRPYSPPRRDGHGIGCMCGGSGWLEVVQHSEDGRTWDAWARCPKGPPTAFVEPSELWDQYAGAAAHETHSVLAARAGTRAALAEACFAAAAAYRNAQRVTLLP